jgi:hypothetical protein
MQMPPEEKIKKPEKEYLIYIDNCYILLIIAYIGGFCHESGDRSESASRKTG